MSGQEAGIRVILGIGLLLFCLDFVPFAYGTPYLYATVGGGVLSIVLAVTGLLRTCPLYGARHAIG